MIFVDSNIPMYLVGADHAHKLDARRALERLIAEEHRLVCDAEVPQEILHRYTAIGRRDAIQPAFEVLLGLVDEVFPIELTDVQRAKEVLFASPRLSARATIHVAVMERYEVEEILSFDAGFDRHPGVRRIAE